MNQGASGRFRATIEEAIVAAEADGLSILEQSTILAAQLGGRLARSGDDAVFEKLLSNMLHALEHAARQERRDTEWEASAGQSVARQTH